VTGIDRNCRRDGKLAAFAESSSDIGYLRLVGGAGLATGAPSGALSAFWNHINHQTFCCLGLVAILS
jgi:hypothetical protein